MTPETERLLAKARDKKCDAGATRAEWSDRRLARRAVGAFHLPPLRG